MYCCSSFLVFLKHTYFFTRAGAGAEAGQKKTGAGAGQKWTGSATLPAAQSNLQENLAVSLRSPVLLDQP